MEDNWWTQKTDEIQALADTDYSRSLFQVLKIVYGPSQSTVSHFSELMVIPYSSQKSRFLYVKEHFAELLNHSMTPDQSVLDTISQCPIQHELAEPPTLEEVQKVIAYMSNNKGPGLDGIPATVYKYGGELLHVAMWEMFKEF